MRVLFLKTVKFREVLSCCTIVPGHLAQSRAVPETASFIHRITEEDVSVGCWDSSRRLVPPSSNKAIY